MPIVRYCFNQLREYLADMLATVNDKCGCVDSVAIVRVDMRSRDTV